MQYTALLQITESLAITNFKNIDLLNTRVFQDRTKAKSDLKPIYALDTETFEGNIFMIADSGRFR